MDPDAAARLWKLTRGNALYLRNIVEQEIADGRIQLLNGYWQWIGEPIMPKGLVELIEARFGALSHSVGEVIDALAVGEPLEMTTLRRIADPDAIEEAHVRGLITVDKVDDGMEVRLAHPLYGEVRRSRSPETRLRRLRGLVATELASAADSDDMRNVVRRATLSLDSDLTPDADLMLKAAGGAVWLGDLRLADRLAKAAIRADGAPRAYFLRAHALSWLLAGQEADAVLAELSASKLTDDDRGRLAYLRASNTLWALGDAPRAKKIIDEAARAQCASHLDRRFPHRVLVCSGPAARGDTGVGKPCAGRSACRRGGRDRMGACRGACGRGADHRSGGRRRTRDTPLRLGSSTPRTCDSTSPTRTSAHCCWRARWRMDSKWHNACTSSVLRCRGQPTCSAPRSRVGPRFSRVDLTRRVPCWDRQLPHCRHRGMPSAGATGITSHTPPRWRCGAQPTKLPRCSPRSTDPTSISHAGLRAQPGPRMAGGWAGRPHRGDHHDVGSSRNRGGQRTIRGRGGMPADRRPVRGLLGRVSTERTRIDGRGATREPGRPVRDRAEQL